MRKVAFTIRVEPQTKARPRLNRNTGAVYTPRQTRDYERLVGLMAKSMVGTKGYLKPPVHARLHFFLPFPAKTKRSDRLEDRYAVTKPDLDNLEKAVLDACNGIVYADDREVAYVEKGKFYSDVPRLEVEFSELEG